MHASPFLVPAADSSGRAQVAHLEGNVMTFRAPLGFDFAQPGAISAEYVAGLLPARATRARVFRARLEMDGSLVRQPDLVLPPHLKVCALALHGPYLYVGGVFTWPRRSAVRAGAAGGRLDLREEQPRWEPLVLPGPAEPGKALDDVLADDQNLILVDNIVFPKYLFVYLWPPSGGLPTDPQVVELPFSRVYEHIEKGQMSAGYVALLSTSAGMDGVGAYVSVLRRGDWAPVVVFAFEQSREEIWAQDLPDELPAPEGRPFDLALQEHRLVLACPGALLCVDLRAFPSPSGLAAEADCPVVDLRHRTPVPGGHWQMLGPHEQPEHIRFVAPGRLLLALMGDGSRTPGRAWLQSV
ncbi:hypothetical protein SAMN00120144_3129 [Hymenobacter roseosalivarius DSM 11622]|uniref:Uncharacterized protein n=1 Tax=Hymenobacter roseosalivarius DSM 11622 TaxID=645990 RepID=A0A1W1UEA7_9BACT|nr:hypothetical protein [Hymenobacter roseosalivarius]SMB79407.1 hypothetical protein SAMN00120144_3129 [Hymenobacter roseosalivarius DSM 11622]